MKLSQLTPSPSALTRVGKCAVNGPLSLRERVGVRVKRTNTYPWERAGMSVIDDPEE